VFRHAPWLNPDRLRRVRPSRLESFVARSGAAGKRVPFDCQRSLGTLRRGRGGGGGGGGGVWVVYFFFFFFFFLGVLLLFVGWSGCCFLFSLLFGVVLVFRSSVGFGRGWYGAYGVFCWGCLGVVGGLFCVLFLGLVRGWGLSGGVFWVLVGGLSFCYFGVSGCPVVGWVVGGGGGLGGRPKEEVGRPQCTDARHGPGPSLAKPYRGNLT